MGSVLRGTYEITSLLGKGGMGAVYLARHRRLTGKNVAVKVLLGGANIPQELYARFRREAEVTTQLGHPNIVEMLDFDTMEDGTPFLVMEYLRGESLEHRLERGPLSVPEMVALMRQIGSALAAAHRVGVVHRDLKPANVFLVPTDSGGVVGERVKLLDFGISKMLDSQTLQTQEAVLMGTPQYMAPEQALGKNSEVDARTDLFALGCIVYEMLSGRPPFAGEGSSVIQVVFRIVHAHPEPLASLVPGLPEHVVSAVERALSKTPADRPPDIATFISELTGTPMMSLASQPQPLSATPSRPSFSGSGSAGTGRYGLEEELGATHMPSAAAPASTARFSLPDDDGGLGATHMPGSLASAPVPAPPTPPASTARFSAPVDDGGLGATHMPAARTGTPALVSQAGAAAPVPQAPVPSAPMPSAPMPSTPVPSAPEPVRRGAVSRWAAAGGGAVLVLGLVAGGAWWMGSQRPAAVTPSEVPPGAVPPKPSAPPPSPPEPSAATYPSQRAHSDEPANVPPANVPPAPPPPVDTPDAPVKPVVATRPETGKPKPPVSRPPASAADEKEKVPEEVRELLEQAEVALAQKNHAEVIRLAQQSQRKRPTAKSYALLLRAYCSLGRLGDAQTKWREASNLLRGGQKDTLRQFCAKRDIELK